MTADFILNDGLLTADGNCLLFINKRFGTINKFDFSGNIINEINPFNNLDDNSSRIIKKNQDLFIKGSFISRSSRMVIPEYFVCRRRLLEKIDYSFLKTNIIWLIKH